MKSSKILHESQNLQYTDFFYRTQLMVLEGVVSILDRSDVSRNLQVLGRHTKKKCIVNPAADTWSTHTKSPLFLSITFR